MKCLNCGKDFEEHPQKKYCSPKCKDRYKYLRDRSKVLNRYYLNRKEILKQQTKRWTKRYKSDIEFRARRYIRDKTTRMVSLKDKKCTSCGVLNDLQRHHPDSKDYQRFVVLCRKCHNMLHFG